MQQKKWMVPLGALMIAWLLLSAHAAVAESQPINVNAASATELTSLKGIGQVKAQAIVAYREEHGPFKTVDDLKLVRGIGGKLLDRLRPQVSVAAASDKREPLRHTRQAGAR